MNGYWLASFIGLVIVLNGCATTGNMTQNQGDSQGAVNPQVQSFSGLGDVSQTPKGLTLVLSGDSLFKVGYTHLNTDGIQKVDEIAAVLMKYPGDLVTILEYTDNGGAAAKNLKLSQRRADSIKKELLKQGVSGDNVSAVGKGEADPVAPNDSSENRAKNRRAVVEITTS